MNKEQMFKNLSDKDKKDKEIEYQKGLTELYEETQEMGRGDFAKMIYDLKEATENN